MSLLAKSTSHESEHLHCEVDRSTIEFTDLLNIFERKKIQFSVEIMPWELKKRQFVMLITDVTIQILVSNLLCTKLYYND